MSTSARRVYIGGAQQHFSELSRSSIAHLLLFYDEIAVPMLVDPLKFMPRLDHFVERLQASEPTERRALQETAMSASLADHWVSLLVDYNVEDFDALRSVMVPISAVNETIADYLSVLQSNPVESTSQDEHRVLRRDIFHPALLDLLQSFVPWESVSQREEAYTALYDFVCAAIADRKGLITGRVTSIFEILLSRALARADPIDISRPDPETGRLNILRRWLDVATVNELASYRQAPGFDVFENILDLEVPQLGDVPLTEVLKFRKRDHIQPLISQAIEWSLENPQMNTAELTERIQHALWDVAETLWPNAKTEIIGAVGQIPTGPIPLNPIGLVSWLYGAYENRKLRRNYGWVIVVADLKHLSRVDGA